MAAFSALPACEIKIRKFPGLFLFGLAHLLSMDIDWIVGISLFMVFAAFGFSYYFALVSGNGANFEVAAETQRENIIAFVSVGVYEAPVKYNSSASLSDAVLKAKAFLYSGERNSTRVLSNETALPCRLDGDDVYWQADLAQGFNVFRIRTADVNSTLNCTGTFAITSSELAVPWAFEKKAMASLTKIYELANTSYEQFREALGINMHFRLVLQAASGNVSYGRTPPSGAVNVYSKTTETRLFETSENANITVAVWG